MISVELKPLLGRLNETCARALERAAGLCVSRGAYEVAIEHLLLTLAEDPGADIQCILRHYELDLSHVKQSLLHATESVRAGNPGKPVFSPLLIESVQEAWLLASLELGEPKIRSGAILATLIANARRYGLEPYMDELNVIPGDELRRRFHDITAGSSEQPVSNAGGESSAETQARSQGSALERFTIDFTGRARAGDIDPVFCREREIRQMIDILGRRRKNNPIAVGEAGVGKTAVVEGLALKIVQSDVPECLQDVEIYGLDMGLLQAGASVKGEFENRLKSVIEEVKASPKPIILFIDEAHTLIGAGAAAGGSDAANLLKPALARGELRTVAATTWSEYKKYFEKDPALARRFQLVKLDEPGPDEAVLILRGLRDAYEQAHGVYVRDDAIDAAARMSARYISGRQLPDKAVDVLDTACARVKLSLSGKPDPIDDRERQIQTFEQELHAVRRDVEAGVRGEDGAMASLETELTALKVELVALNACWADEREVVEKIIELRGRLSDARKASNDGTAADAAGDKADVGGGADMLEAALDAARRQLQSLQGDAPLIHYEVTPEVVARVIADWTGVPLGKMVRDDAASVLRFEQLLSARIRGQADAVEVVSRGLRSAKAGMRGGDAPMGVFLLVGPSGVGKTECALGVADQLFGGERFITTINMSEFQEKHAVSRLIGSPPGYVGFGEGGLLTEAVRQRPYSVVLLDEVEKADLEVMNLFYQVFDKGVLSDGEGRAIDFKNTVIFLTSNLASDIVTNLCSGGERPTPEAVIEAIRPVLSHHFKPALLARMEIVPFYPIAPEAMGEIAELKLNRLKQQLQERNRIDLQYDAEVVEQIAKRCTEVETGARNIDHIINRTLLPQLATHVLEGMGSSETPDSLHVSIAEDGGFSVVPNSSDRPEPIAVGY